MKYKIIVDKQPSTNPTDEKRTYEIDIEELRVKGDVYDSLIITKDEAYVMRRLSLSEYHVLSVLENEVKEPLTDIDLTLFEGDNYIYLMDLTGNKFYAEYLVKNDFNDIFCTRNEMNSAIVQSANQIELNVNQKLTGYSTTEEINSVITQKANEITSTVSNTYATKNALNTAKTEIKQTTDSITSTVSQKVGNDEIISKINQSVEATTIQANKVNLNGFVTVTDLKTNGKTVINGSNITTGTIDASKVTVQNLNADNIKSGTISGRSISGGTITGTQISNGSKFNVDKNGKMSCSDADITGGSIKLKSSGSSTISIENTNNSNNLFGMSNYGFTVYGGSNNEITLNCDPNGNTSLELVSGYSGYTSLSPFEVLSPTITQTSLAIKKKNFEKLQNALDILKNIDIYKYNFKDEDDKIKKHIGFVIGEQYKYREEVTSNKNNGVDLYSFVSLCCKAIQEQQEKIDKLEERLEVLENG